MTRVRVFIACSLDGFIAGPNDDLSWLPGADGSAVELGAETEAVSYETFIAEVGALLMGRRSYDVVSGFAGPWPYPEMPVLVATHRPLTGVTDSVRTVQGDIDSIVEAAREAAAGKDVYLDGGELIRQALDADLVDELIVTMVPVLLGEGRPLFAGVTRRHTLKFVAEQRYGSMLQLVLQPKR